MIEVYFESKSHAELAAIFESEQAYEVCLPALEKLAATAGMFVTESVAESIQL